MFPDHRTEDVLCLCPLEKLSRMVELKEQLSLELEEKKKLLLLRRSQPQVLCCTNTAVVLQTLTDAQTERQFVV